MWQVALGLAVAGSGLGFLINAVSGAGGDDEASVQLLPEETKRYYIDSLKVLKEIRDGKGDSMTITMNRDVVGRATSQSQSESGTNLGRFNS